MRLYLGIDTSCYTTSLALMDSEGNLLSETRKILTVPPGGRGLAQNEAIFQHVNNLPELFKKLRAEFSSVKLSGIAASTRPRPVNGSYMPVFRVAHSFGNSMASLLDIPFVETTHQEGHIAAGIWSTKRTKSMGDKEFLVIHLSGGTTEILRVIRNSGDSKNFYNIELLGGTQDLHAGQFVDRVGVALGLPFPAGPHLEKLARDAEENFSLPSSVKGYAISFSGPEAAAMRMIGQGVPARKIARAVERCICNTLQKVLKRAVNDTGLSSVLIVGGVAANTYLREKLTSKLTGCKLYYAQPSLSSDNAVGAAWIGMNVLETEKVF